MIGIKNVKTVILSIQNQINTKQPQNANPTEYVHRMIMTILFIQSRFESNSNEQNSNTTPIVNGKIFRPSFPSFIAQYILRLK